MKFLLSCFTLFSALHSANAQPSVVAQCAEVCVWNQGANHKEGIPNYCFPYINTVLSPTPLAFLPSTTENNIELNFDACQGLTVNKVRFDLRCEEGCTLLEPCRPEDNPTDFDDDCDTEVHRTERVEPFFVYGDNPRSGLVRGRFLGPGIYKVEWYLNGDEDNKEVAEFVVVNP